MSQNFDVNKAFQKFTQKNAELTLNNTLLETQVEQLMEIVNQQDAELKEKDAKVKEYEEKLGINQDEKEEPLEKAQLKSVPKKKSKAPKK